ncbi:hypothetical protein N8I77_006829 [Diaporthe amygdali]|uniref:Uncharacterized protein n=1 Tax=Phomopsis amygdali TaxID=1214568 RepID=A0AAD9SIS8_PHOAM|nr:hypothetical protein N8I77_006829 [Diaporthe amygdali]
MNNRIPSFAESETGQLDLPCWDEGALSEADVRRFVHQIEDKNCGIWQSAPNSKCHASFGDQGTTATVGAFGQLLHLSHFLGAESSGIFSADHTSVAEPFWVGRRAEDLRELSQQPFHIGPGNSHFQSYGLRFPDLLMKPDAQPQLKWTYWRWPCHEHSRGDFENYPNLKLTTQWMVHEKTVLQQCLLRNDGEDDIQIGVEFSKSMKIRDLDHFNTASNFNNWAIKDYDVGPGPKGYSWVCHEDESWPYESFYGGDTIDDQTESTPDPRISHVKQKTPYGVAVITSVAIDGQVQRFENGITSQKWPVVIKSRQMSKPIDRRHTVELVVAYKLVLFETPEAHWKAATIPFKSMDVDQFLRAQVPLRPSSILISATSKESSPDREQSRDDFFDGDSTKSPEDVKWLHQGKGDKTTRVQTQHIRMDPPVSTPGLSSPQNHLEFVTRRNLEHILSVCSIPVASDNSDTTTSTAVPRDLNDVKAVALTCGDMSSHEIRWSASFFAYRFLVEVYKKLRHLRKEPDINSILYRIETTCRGHLKWLHLIQQQEKGQRFGPKYWVTGKPIVWPHPAIRSWRSEYSLLNTGFQILKAAAYTELSAGNDVASELMSIWAPPWLMFMEISDKRLKYAWPHAMYEGTGVFRLDYHVWVWRALKSLENFDSQAWNLMLKNCDSAPTPISKDDIARLRRNFASGVFLREVYGRFTTENDVLRKPMFAFTRSTRETRFLLHARDTALFYDEMFDFFSEDAASKEIWSDTTNCQLYYDGNQESKWKNPLRYALCIMMGTRGFRINSKLPDELVQTATEALLRICSPNGFFPGQQHLSRRSQLLGFMDEDLDRYYNASFEIPYILLTHVSRLGDAYNRLATPTTEATGPEPNFNGRLKDKIDLQGSAGNEQFHQAESGVGLWLGDSEQREMLLLLLKLLLPRSRAPYLDICEIFGGVSRATNQSRFAMKKSVHFNNSIESSSILEDEWLFNYPQFLMMNPLKSVDFKIASENIDFMMDFWEGRMYGVSDRYGTSRFKQKRKPQKRKPRILLITLNRFNERRLRYCVVDVPSSKSIEGTRRDRCPKCESGTSSEVLEELLTPVRTERDSKKRLLYFSEANRGIVSICYAATETFERRNMLDFFGRHSRHEKYATDRCSMVNNSWETEFHLSYYQILDESRKIWSGIPPFESEPFPGGRGKKIARTSTSFRFNGDLFDRYWTCYWLAYVHNGPGRGWYGPHNPLDRPEDRQRKVLEQRFIAQILTNLTWSIEEILAEVKFSLGIKSQSFSSPIPNIDAYSSWSALWAGFEPLLQTLEEDLASTQVIVDQWEAREEERGEERPRWTRDRERKYGASIMKIHREIKRQTGTLQQLRANIRSLRESCSNRLVRAREELSFRSEQNIASFTFVTVVFLPLGFIASIFSMNGSPETSLVINMVVASVIALGITVLVLMNAKSFASVVDKVSSNFSKLTTDAMRSSLMMQGWEELGNKHKARNDGRLSPAPSRNVPKDNTPGNLVFWTGYMLFEVPAMAGKTGSGKYAINYYAEGSTMHFWLISTDPTLLWYPS